MIDMSYIWYIHIAEIEEIKTTGEWYFIVNKISIQPYGVLMLWSQCPIGWICVMQWQCHQWLIVVYLMENSLNTLRVPCCTIWTIARWLESMYTHLRLSVSLPVSVSLYQIAYLCNYAPGKYIKQYSFLQSPTSNGLVDNELLAHARYQAVVLDWFNNGIIITLQWHDRMN